MNRQKEIPQKMIDDARELYLANGGRRHLEIEREMRARGWKFYREVLYTRRHSHGVRLAWPERFGWVDLLTEEQRLNLRRRNAARNEFEGWLRSEFPEWTWTWKFQRYIYERLAEITGGNNRRLMIFMPPRHGKSEMVTIRYTAWRLLRNPKLNLILGSHTQKLADRFSRKIKRIVQSPSFSLSPTSRKEQAKACTLNTVAEWETVGGGVVRSVGVGAGIAGFGAGLIVIDDPVRNRADAESEAYRERVWDWFNDDVYTRMEPNASIILIQTRWHEDDLAGRLLKEMEHGGEAWEVIRLPALAEESVQSSSFSLSAGTAKKHAEAWTLNGDPLGRKPGEALCPERYDEAALLRYKRKMGSYSFSAMYQQSPVPMEGGRFKRAWFKNIVDRAPDGLRWKRGYDLAVSIKTSADYTASFRCAKDTLGNLYIADGFRDRLEYPDQRKYIVGRMENEADTEHGIEDAMHGQAVVQDLRRERELSRYAFRVVRVKGDKLTRALAWLNLAEEGKVILVRGAWIDDFVDEVCRFPNARHDDQVDAVSLAVAMLSQSKNRFMTFD